MAPGHGQTGTVAREKSPVQDAKERHPLIRAGLADVPRGGSGRGRPRYVTFAKAAARA